MKETFDWNVFSNNKKQIEILLQSKEHPKLVGRITIIINPYDYKKYEYNRIFIKIHVMNQFEMSKNNYLLNKISTLMLELSDGDNDNYDIFNKVLGNDALELKHYVNSKFSRTEYKAIANQAFDEIGRLYHEIIGEKIMNIIKRKEFNLKGL
jgi:hypothetical protein